MNPGHGCLLPRQFLKGVVTPQGPRWASGVCEEALEERVAEEPVWGSKPVPKESFRDESKAKVGRGEGTGGWE